MPQRTIRLNKIVCNELNILLHTLFRDASEKISITETNVSPDLRDAYVYFSVVGDDKDIKTATKFLAKNSKVLRQKLFQRVQLKFSPRLNFRYDESLARGQKILSTLDSLQDSNE